jgi:protein involved in polysaccharide export with SLBB domain
MLALDLPENNNQDSVRQALENFKVQDGDKIKISPIVAFADKTVYLDGHVFRPGKYAYRDGMKVTDLVKSYKDVLPEPYKQHAEIIRLKAPDYTPEILAFNLEDALAGKDQDIVLKPFDTVRVFGRYDFEDVPVVTVSGSVRDPGDHVTNGATHLRDAIYLAGSTTPDAKLDDVQIFRKTDDGKLKVLSVNLSKALSGDTVANILLEPKDRVFVHKNLAKTDPPAVTIEGEVERPGKYPLGENMSAADLVRLSGGFKRSAYTEQADLTRYMAEPDEKIAGDHENVQIAKALAGEPDTDVRLHDGDVLTIRQLAGWNDLAATIGVQGEVLHPATYGIQEGERLSSILARAGGFRRDAYPYGAVFQRVQVRDLEEKNRAQLVRQVQTEGASLKAVDDPLSRESAALQWKNTLEKLQNTPPPGRMVIHISGDVKRWANTPADIQVRAGDVIYIPKKPNFIMVDGAVYNPTAVTFKPGKSAGWYLQQAGGPTTMANKKAIFVIRADGTVVGGKGGMFSGGAVDVALQPGDMAVVPDKAFGGGITWKNTLQVAQLVSAVGIAVQVAKGF